jgi:NAD(P)H-hydrate epimerase
VVDDIINNTEITVRYNPNMIGVTIVERHQKAITSSQMYAIEEKAHTHFGFHRLVMMENAGHGIADFVNAKYKKRSAKTRLVAVCGTGNNGGDGFVAARHLSGYPDYVITVILLGRQGDLRTEEARVNWEIISKMDSVETICCDKFDRKLKMKISRTHVILDGIFGTGIRGEIRDPHASAIQLINKSRARVIAVDIPSGLDPDTGKVGRNCIKANATVTFHRLKTGLLNNLKHTGDVHVEHIGIPKESERGILRSSQW